MADVRTGTLNGPGFLIPSSLHIEDSDPELSEMSKARVRKPYEETLVVHLFPTSSKDVLLQV